MIRKPSGSSFGPVSNCYVLLEKEISMFTKVVCRWKHEVAPKSPGRNRVDLIKYSIIVGPPAPHQQVKQHLKSSETVGTPQWTSDTCDSDDDSILISKEDWAAVQFIFSLAQESCFWCCLWFWSGSILGMHVCAPFPSNFQLFCLNVAASFLCTPSMWKVSVSIIWTNKCLTVSRVGRLDPNSGFNHQK